MNQPLAETIFWIAAVACAVAEIAILRSIIAQRRTQNSGPIHSGSPAGEIIWGIIPALALAALLAATWRRIEARERHMQMHHGAHEMTSVERDAGREKRDAGSNAGRGKPDADQNG
jgi:heme/copper-type cytochrome/quinol oxidase subunit 2